MAREAQGTKQGQQKKQKQGQDPRQDQGGGEGRAFRDEAVWGPLSFLGAIILWLFGIALLGVR